MVELQFDPNKRIRHILSLSGGKDSTALAIHMRRNHPDITLEYVFCDTGSELDETYQYLNQVEAFLGKRITRLPQDMPNGKSYVGFEHWLKVYGGYLPAPNMRWCTRMLKLKPFEDFIGDDNIVSYVGIRADEKRVGYISHKPTIKTVYPFKDDGIDYAGVMRILEESGIGLPPYLKWGRSHSGCYFCFFQRPIEWVYLLETHPVQFDKAQSFEKISDDPGKTFTWCQRMPLSELRKPENIAAIKQRYEEKEQRKKRNRKDMKLIETLAGLEVDDDAPKACLICQL